MLRELKFLAFILSLTTLWACSNGGGSGSSGGNSSSNSSSNFSSNSSSSSSSSGDFNYSAMLTNFADNIIIPGYQDFADKSASFYSASGSLATYCSAIGQANENTALADAQAAWLELMTSWQKTEMFQIGPVTDQSGFLRNLIHSYGATSGVDTCLADRNAVAAQQANFNVSAKTLAERGLSVIEYLIFNSDLGHTCSAANDQTNTWATYSDTQKKNARCELALLIAEDVASTATSIHQAWIPSGGDYRNTYITGNAEEFLQETSDALFYFEKITKDVKLGIPLGIKKTGTPATDLCSEIACPNRVESPYSKASLRNIKVNLDTFWQLYTGLNGSGFDDIITASNMSSVNQSFETDVTAAQDFVNQMIANGDSVIGQVEAIVTSGSHTACTNSNAEPDSVTTVTSCSLHGLLKRITDRLRTDFIMIVNVDLPSSAAGDAD